MKLNKKVIACVPTYCEPQKVAKYLESCKFIKHRPFQLIIVNANPGDETSEIIEQEKKLTDYEIVEVCGQNDEFWSATVNRGLRLISENAKPEDWVLISNIDIVFDTDIVRLLLEQALKQGSCQMGAIFTSNNYAISSGVQVKSWMATLTVHPYAGRNIDNIPDDLLIKVDYLPTRCMLFSVEALTKVGLISDKWLPHYAADYEFSRRLTRAGYVPYLYTGGRIEVDKENTGQSVYSSQTSFSERISNLMNIKNPSNPKFRIVFVLLVYPLYAIPTATFFYLLRTVIEVILSKKQIFILFGKNERGFSE
jgi:GT2 family glycosyltransferase